MQHLGIMYASFFFFGIQSKTMSPKQWKCRKRLNTAFAMKEALQVNLRSLKRSISCSGLLSHGGIDTTNTCKKGAFKSIVIQTTMWFIVWTVRRWLHLFFQCLSTKTTCMLFLRCFSVSVFSWKIFNNFYYLSDAIGGGWCSVWQKQLQNYIEGLKMKHLMVFVGTTTYQLST